MEDKIRNLEIRQGTFCVAVPKFKSESYKIGRPVEVIIDRMKNKKLCIYHKAHHKHEAGKSYKAYNNDDLIFNDFDFFKSMRQVT